MRRNVLIALLSLGAIGGYTWGFMSLKHHRGCCASACATTSDTTPEASPAPPETP